MAKLPNGILGGIRGKVGGAVGGSWKGVNYIRSYARPGYSRTDAQAAQRDNMQYLVSAAKPFVGPVCKNFTDKFISRLSGFNWIIRENMAAKKLSSYVTLLKVSSGPLYPGSDLAGVIGGSNTAVTWNTGLGLDGAATDVAIVYVRNTATNEVNFILNQTRGDGSATVPNVVDTGSDDIVCGVFFARMNTSGDVVERISTNLSAMCS